MLRVGWRSTAAIILTSAMVTAWLLRPPPRPQAPAEQPPLVTGSTEVGLPLLSRDAEAGRFLFERYCSDCHGRTGDGLGVNAPNLRVEVPDLTAATHLSGWDDSRLSERIARGGGTSERPPVCPAWGRRLTPREIDALVAFIRVLSSGKLGGRANTARSRPPLSGDLLLVWAHASHPRWRVRGSVGGTAYTVIVVSFVALVSVVSRTPRDRIGLAWGAADQHPSL